jgi:hypothetical protein
VKRAGRIFTQSVAVVVAGIAAALATASGCLATVDWLIDTFGGMAVLLLAAFTAGCVITHACHRAVSAWRQPGSVGP